MNVLLPRTGLSGTSSLAGIRTGGGMSLSDPDCGFTRLNLNSSGEVLSAFDFSSSSLTLSFLFAPALSDFPEPSSASSFGGDWNTDTRLILNFGLLSRRFFLVSRFIDSAGSALSTSSSGCSSVGIAGCGSNLTGSTSSKWAIGGGPRSGDCESGASRMLHSSSALKLC